ncbi:MAG: hypothetical protein ABFD79_07485, partial [Phycisphaerales bacterium]
MLNLIKSSKINFLSICLTALFSIVFVQTLFASLPFDPNKYTFLVYTPRGDYQSDSNGSIEQTMHDLGIRSYDLRDPAHPVTPTDLETHDILIIGWNKNGSNNGLHSDDLAAYINGRVILTGHDADFHFPYGDKWAPEKCENIGKFIANAIDYVLDGGGTGMIAFHSTFSYLP